MLSNNPENEILRLRYDSMWDKSIDQIRSGLIEQDPILAKGAGDSRRGMTLRFRPSICIQEQVQHVLKILQELEPDQHYYHTSDLHVTFLSLFTAKVDNQPYFARTEEYVAAVTVWVSTMKSFSISFLGITATANAILLQGFVNIKALNAARDELRAELRRHDLGSSLDSRYRLETAHMTVARFSNPMRQPAKFANALSQFRGFDFGSFEVQKLELVKNDWYMSASSVELLRTYDI